MHSHIIVVPASLVSNWEAEFDKWVGKASQPKRVAVRSGGADGLHLIRSFAENQSQMRSNRVGQVLIVSYELFRKHTEVIHQAMAGSIGILICDEAHRLKNTAGTQTMTSLDSLQAESRLLITASPVQNDLSEFYCLINFARPGLLGDLSSFRKEFERPIAGANRKNANSAEKALAARQSRQLEALTKSTVLRRLQVDVLYRALPPRTEILLFCKLSEKQNRVYREVSVNHTKQLHLTDALETLTNLRKVCAHPSMLTGEEKCPIELADSGKLSVLASLLQDIRKSSDSNKVVLVSNFTSTLSLVEDLILKPQNLTYLRLDGTVPTQNRQLLVDTFNKTSASRTFCFLLSAKAGGCGLNLVGANKMILFDNDWNPSVSDPCFCC
jgi:SNF2 family DNA or RNA helicase